MTQYIKKFSFFALPVLLASGFYFFSEHELCEGFVEENDMKIHVNALQQGGLNEEQFNEVLDRFETHYRPVIEGLGARLDLRRRWSDPTVNASASRSGNTYIINMYGGLARHAAITADGFMIVACHEAGHHIGGAPKISGWWNSWASNEGQSDYFANLQCLRRVWSDEENRQWLEAQTDIDPFAQESCERVYNTQEEEILCIRSAMAGRSVSRLFQDLRNEETEPRFDTPSDSEVSRTDDRHPATQCRMDTYFQGSLCPRDPDGDVDQEDPLVGTCNRSQGDQAGVRPRCWYKPPAAIVEPGLG